MAVQFQGEESTSPTSAGLNGPSDTALLARFYEELRQIAARQRFREGDALTIQTTEIVHEAYLRLASADLTYNDEAHLLATATQAMRRLLIDRARQRKALRRGSGVRAVQLDDAHHVAAHAREDALLALDEALHLLAERHPDMARVVDCRFFGGLTSEQTAQALGLSLRTAERLWTRARVHLHDLLQAGG